jgi:MFS family permease
VIELHRRAKSDVGPADPAFQIGVVFLLQSVSNALSRIPFGALSDRWGQRKHQALVGAVLTTLSIAGFATARSFFHFQVAAVCQGMSLAIAFTAIGALIAETTEPRTRGLAMGGYNSFIYFGVLHGIAVMLIVARLSAGWGAWLWPLGAVAVGLSWLAKTAGPAWVAAVPALDVFNTPALNWLGLVSRLPITEDYVPLLPWLAAVWWRSKKVDLLSCPLEPPTGCLSRRASKTQTSKWCRKMMGLFGAPLGAV